MGLFDALLDNLNPQRVYDRRVAGWQERQQGLLGSIGTIPGDMGPSPTDSTGTGLFGGQITPMQYAQATMLNPLYKDQGLSMVNSLTGNQAAMARQQQEQAFGMNNISAVDQARLDMTRQQNAMSNQISQNRYGMDMMKDQAKLGMDAYKEIMKQNEGPRKVMTMTNAINARLPGFSNGAVDWDAAIENPTIAHQAVVTLAKSILGEEAVNVDDNRAIRATGATGKLAEWVAFVNNGTMGATQLEQIITALNSNAAQAEAIAKQNQADMAWHPGTAIGAPSPVKLNRLPTGSKTAAPAGGVDPAGFVRR